MLRILAVLTTLCLLLAVPARAEVIGADASRPMDLFGNTSKLKPGDMLTVLVQESVSVNSGVKQNETNSDTTFSVFEQVPGLQALGERARKNENSTSQTHGLSTVMTVQVMSVAPDGSMELQGTRIISANGRKVTMHMSGIARPQDVQPDNTVFSNRLVNLDLKVDGLPRKQGFDFIRSIFGIFF